MPAGFAALSALRKFLQAIIMCHFSVSARAFAVARPSPEEAPVIITLPFLKVFFVSDEARLISGVVVAVCAMIGLSDNFLLNSCRFKGRCEFQLGRTHFQTNIIWRKESYSPALLGCNERW
ncbi:hypothetical protein U1Q18_029344 [Sarracenia purpurea var. burkii]